MVIHEGRNRQIRRMCEAVGHPVLRLVRTRIGPLADPSLGPGSYRPLTFDEVRSLAAAALPTGEEGGPVPLLGDEWPVGSDDGPE
jgi:23S rRNA pseudouridine2605 synthase